jgi:membrane protein insertase Oxa1/YidC/SpoIIIJ
LDKYFETQDVMQVQAKTMSALKEKHTAPTKKKQMFDLMKGKGLYKKFPLTHFKKFKTWLQSPSGGQLKCPDEIISEISRYVFISPKCTQSPL